MLEDAGYMALVVMEWVFVIGLAGSVALMLAVFAMEFYEEHFRK